MRPQNDLVERLRDALTRSQRACAELTAARRDEAAALSELRATGVSWWAMATKLAPICERRRLAKALRQRAWRFSRVSRSDVNHSAEAAPASVQAGAGSSAPSSSIAEVATMPTKLIKRTTTVEEFEPKEEMGDADLDREDTEVGDEDVGDSDDSDDEQAAKSPKRRGR